jgi:hypothetical protein
MIRDIWALEFAKAPRHRLRVMDMAFAYEPSIFLLLEYEGITEDASALLRKIKGSRIYTERRPGQLRSKIEAGDGVLSCIHTPDTYLEFLREVDILLFEAETVDLSAHVGARLEDDLSVYDGYAFNSLRLEDVMIRIEHHKPSGSNERDWHYLLQCVSALIEERKEGYVRSAMRRCKVERWDMIVVENATSLSCEFRYPKFRGAYNMLQVKA